MFGDKKTESFGEQSISHKDYLFLPIPFKYFLPHVTVHLWLPIRRNLVLLSQSTLCSPGGEAHLGKKCVLTLLNTEDED